MQFAESLSDRDASDAVHTRIDWKHLLGLKLTDSGFDHSILSRFRDRLIDGQAEMSLLQWLLEKCPDPPCELIPSITLTFLLCRLSDNSALRQHRASRGVAVNVRCPDYRSFVRKAKRCRATDALDRGCDQGDCSIQSCHAILPFQQLTSEVQTDKTQSPIREQYSGTPATIRLLRKSAPANCPSACLRLPPAVVMYMSV
jgi:hypothetical protein